MAAEAPVIIDEAGENLAEAQAANDAAVWAKLEEERKARVAERKAQVSTIVLDDVAEAEGEFEPAPGEVIRERPMNRAERRSQVKLYASLLAASNKQAPVRNPTIIPKSKRRRRPGQKGRLQHA